MLAKDFIGWMVTQGAACWLNFTVYRRLSLVVYSSWKNRRWRTACYEWPVFFSVHLKYQLLRTCIKIVSVYFTFRWWWPRRKKESGRGITKVTYPTIHSHLFPWRGSHNWGGRHPQKMINADKYLVAATKGFGWCNTMLCCCNKMICWCNKQHVLCPIWLHRTNIFRCVGQTLGTAPNPKIPWEISPFWVS